MKPQNAYRPLVETLESRLQPGSILMMQGSAWFAADHLSLLKEEPRDSHGLVEQASSENSNPALTSKPEDVHSDRLKIAVASVAAARSENSSSLPSDLVDNRTDGLTKN